MDREVEDEIHSLQANVRELQNTAADTDRSIKSINATLQVILDRLPAVGAAGAAGGADGVAGAAAGPTGAATGAAGWPETDPQQAERALRDMRRALSAIPKFSGDRAGPNFRQHVEAVRTHNHIYNVYNSDIAKSGLLMSLTGSAATRASGAGMRSTIFTEAAGFEEYAVELLGIFEPDSEKQIARSEFVNYKQGVTEDIGTYLATKADLWRSAFPDTELTDDSAFVSYTREVVSGIYSRVIRRLVIRENPKTVDHLKTACLEAVSGERRNWELGCAESLNLDGLASVTRGHQRRKPDEAMEVNAIRPSKDLSVTCGYCGTKGHRTSECRKKMKATGQQPPKQTEKRKETRVRDKAKETRTCRACGKAGHIEVNCWAKHGKPKRAAVNAANPCLEDGHDEDDWDWNGPDLEDGINALHQPLQERCSDRRPSNLPGGGGSVACSCRGSFLGNREASRE